MAELWHFLGVYCRKRCRRSLLLLARSCTKRCQSKEHLDVPVLYQSVVFYDAMKLIPLHDLDIPSGLLRKFAYLIQLHTFGLRVITYMY